jgi:GrpB-like predicted nucleotidyltransferase (UPF0157 family)
VGLDDGPIRIVEHDDAWPAAYTAERERLTSLLPGLHLHHIGSTAVPHLAAKPVIDMIALVEELDGPSGELVRRAGYHIPALFNEGLVHRRYLCYPTTTLRTHHLHLVDRREGVEQCLAFRDRLRSDPQLAADYAALKRSLATRFRADRMGYTQAKTAFIEAALASLHPDRGATG